MCGGENKPKETAEERELGRIAIERWNDYQSRFVPVEDQYIADVQKTEGDFDFARRSTNAGVQQSFDGAEDGLRSALTSRGVTPDSGQFRKAMAGVSTDRATSVGTGLNEADLAVDTEHLRGLQSVVQIGQGQAMDALDGMGNVAANATRDSIDRANRSFENRQAGLHLAGTAAGIGTSTYMNSSPGPNLQGQGKPLTDNAAYVKNY